MPTTRNVTSPSRPVTSQISSGGGDGAEPDPTPDERFRLYRLCSCSECGGRGRLITGSAASANQRCDECRGEGRVRELVATCAEPQDVGVAIVQLAREGEFADCPFGLLDTMGEKGKKWLILPWLPSPRNISDAARTLAGAKKGDAG